MHFPLLIIKPQPPSLGRQTQSQTKPNQTHELQSAPTEATPSHKPNHNPHNEAPSPHPPPRRHSRHRPRRQKDHVHLLQPRSQQQSRSRLQSHSRPRRQHEMIERAISSSIMKGLVISAQNWRSRCWAALLGVNAFWLLFCYGFDSEARPFFLSLSSPLNQLFCSIGKL